MNQLTKDCSADALKNYFAGVIALSKSSNPYPVDLDDVWPLLFTQKQNAVKILKNKRNFRKGFDYIEKEEETIFYLEVKNKSEASEYRKTETRGRKAKKYYLTLSTLENLVVKRIDGVFDVYSKVFRFAIRKTEEHLLSIVPTTMYNLNFDASVDDIYYFLGEMIEKEKKGDLHPIFLPEVFALYFPTLERAIKELKKYSSDYVMGMDYIYKEDGNKTGYYLSFNGFNNLIASRSTLTIRAYKKAVAKGLIQEMPLKLQDERRLSELKLPKRMMKMRKISGSKKEQASEIVDRLVALYNQSEIVEELDIINDALNRMSTYINLQTNLKSSE